MRFSALRIQRLREALEALADPYSDRYVLEHARCVLTTETPDLIEAYCTAVGIEIPAK